MKTQDVHTADSARIAELERERVVARAVIARLDKAMSSAADDIADLAFCEECGEECGKRLENNSYPPRYCHGCYHQVVAQVWELRAQVRANAAIVAAAEGFGYVENAASHLSNRPSDDYGAAYRILLALRDELWVELQQIVRARRKED